MEGRQELNNLQASWNVCLYFSVPLPEPSIKKKKKLASVGLIGGRSELTQSYSWVDDSTSHSHRHHYRGAKPSSTTAESGNAQSTVSWWIDAKLINRCRGTLSRTALDNSPKKKRDTKKKKTYHHGRTLMKFASQMQSSSRTAESSSP